MAITVTHSDSLRLLAPLGRRTGRPQRPADLAWFEECGAPVRAKAFSCLRKAAELTMVKIVDIKLQYSWGL